MSLYALSILLTSLAAGQTNTAVESPASNVAIERAIEDLGSTRFRTRDRASKFLWQQGLAAEAALRDAAMSPDREVRQRAKAILEDFHYGILPTTPVDVLISIRRFRDGDPQERQSAFGRLVEGRHFLTVQRLLALETNPAMRRMFLQRLFQNEEAVANFIELGSIQNLINAVGADQDDNWRRQMLSQLLFAPKFLEQLIAGNKLDVLSEYIQNVKSAAVRRQLLSGLFGNPTAVQQLLAQKQFTFLMDFVKSEPDAAARGQFVMQLAGNSTTLRALIESGELATFLDFVERQTDEQLRKTIYTQMFRSSSTVTRLLASQGLEKLVAWVNDVKDPEMRGQLLGQLMGNSAVRKKLVNDGAMTLVLKTAEKEDNPVARRAYLKQLLQSSIMYSLSDQAMISGLWALIKADDDADWQAEALSRLLSNSRFYQMLTTAQDAQWIMDVLQKCEESSASAMLSRLLSNTRVQTMLIQNGHFETLLKIVQQTNEQIRGTLISRLIGSSAIATHLKSKKQLERLIALAQAQDDAGVRRQLLRGLYGNYTAMESLIESGHYDTLFELALAEEKEDERVGLIGDFFLGRGVVEYLIKNDQQELLLKYVGSETSDAARSKYLERLFRNTPAVSELIDKGHYARLLDAAKSIDDATRRTALVGQFLTNPKTISKLAADTQLQVLIDHIASLDPTQIRTLTQRITRNSTAMEALIKQGHFATLLSWAKAEKEPYRRGAAIGSLISQTNVVKLILAQGDAATLLFDFIRDESDHSARQRMLYYLVGRTTTTGLFIDAGHFDALLTLLKRQPERERGDLMGRFLAAQKTLDWLEKNQRIDFIFALIDETTDATVRRAIVNRLFGSSTTIAFLIKHGHFDTLLDLASRQSDASTRVQWLGSLFASSEAVQQLVERKRVEMLLDLAETISDETSRTNYLVRIMRSPTAIAALADKGMFADLLRACRSAADEKQRAQMISTLLLSPEGIKQLEPTDQLVALVGELLDHKDKGIRTQFLQQVSYRSDTLDALLRLNYLDRIIKGMEDDLAGANQRRYLVRLYSSPAVVQHLANTDQLSRIFALLKAEGNPDQRRQLISTLCQNTSTLSVILAHAGLDALLEQINRDPTPSNRTSMLSVLLYSNATMEHLHQRKNLMRAFALADENPEDVNLRRRLLQAFLRKPAQQGFDQPGVTEAYIKLLEKEDSSTRASYATQFLQNTAIRWQFVSAGKLDQLRRVLKLEQNESNRHRYEQAILYSSTGAVAHAVGTGDLKSAELLLREHANTDVGRLRLATYLQVTGRLSEAIEAINDDANPQEKRLLVYLLRANGDLGGASKIANEIGDMGLEKVLAVEREDWAAAASLQEHAACELPVALPHAERYAEFKALERLGLQLAYQRLAGQHGKMQETLKQLTDLRQNSTNKNMQWHSSEILLLNDQFEDGLKLLETHFPQRAFDLYWYRHDFDAALRAVDFKQGSVKAWFDGLSTDGGVSDRDRLFFGLRVARMLAAAGQRDEARQLFDAIESFADAQPTSGDAPKVYCHEYLCRDLLLAGERERAWKVGAKAVTSRTYPPNLLSRIYSSTSRPRRTTQARAWWTFFRAHEPTATSELILERVDQMLRLHRDHLPAEFRLLADAAIDHGAKVTASRRQEYWHGIGQTMYEMQLFADARTCFHHIADEVPAVQLTMADMLREEEKWEAAAALYDRVFEASRDQVIALYLAGECTERAGGDGAERKRHANLLLLDARERHYFAVALSGAGYREAALQQWELLRRVATPEHWECHEAARRMAIATEDPSRCARLWQYYALGDVRPAFYFRQRRSYLSIPFLMHKLQALAAIEAGDFATANIEIDLALAATSTETPICEELVPALDAKGRRDMADQLFDRVYGVYQQRLNLYGNSALLLNNAAWVAARCGRRLDEAQAHAMKAIALQPENGSYLDTYAEVQFQLGNREEAIRYGKRAIAASPDQSSLREQLERFQHEPLPKREE